MRISSFLFCLWMFGLAMAAPAPHCEEVLPKIQVKGVLTIARVDDAHYYYIVPPVIRAMEARIASELAKTLRVTFKWDTQYPSFDEVVKAVKNHQADMSISFLSITPERLKDVNFSTFYANIRYGLVLNTKKWTLLKHTKNLLKILDNSSVKVAVLGHTSYEELGRGLFPYARVVSMNNWDTIVTAVEQGLVSATLMDILEFESQMTKNKSQSKHIVFVPLQTEFSDQIAMVFPKNSCDLQVYANRYLEMNSVSFKVHKLHKPWFLYNVG